jgi:hypothetical protein
MPKGDKLHATSKQKAAAKKEGERRYQANLKKLNEQR